MTRNLGYHAQSTDLQQHLNLEGGYDTGSTRVP